MAKRIYISGQITNLNPLKAFQNFMSAEAELTMKGFEVVNPMRLRHDNDKSWEAYMATDIKALLPCDAVFMLNNWKQSRGARIERAIAMEMNKEIYYQPGGEPWYIRVTQDLKAWAVTYQNNQQVTH